MKKLEKANRYLSFAYKPDLRIYSLSAPPLLAASLSTHLWSAQTEVVLGYTIANLLAFASVLVVFIFLKDRVRPINGNYIAPIAIFGGVLGATKGLATAMAAYSFHLEHDLLHGVLIRTATPVIGVWLALTFAYSKAVLVDLENTRILLARETTRSLHLSPIRIPELEKYLEEAKVDSNLAGDDAKQSAKRIIESVNHHIRLLSHSMMESSALSANDLWGLLRLSLGIKYSALIAAFLHAMSLTTPLAIGGPENLAEGFLLAFILSWLLIRLGSGLQNLAKSLVALQFVLLTLTSMAASSACMLSLEMLGYLNTPVMVIAILSGAWWLGNTLIILGLIRVALEERSDLKMRMQKLFNSGTRRNYKNASTVFERREIANHLHSRVQNQLLAQAIRIEAAADIRLEDELELTRRILTEPLGPTKSEGSNLDALIDRWAGLVAVNISREIREFGLDTSLLEEAITNAFRHGKASQVHITYSEGKVFVEDNGLGPRNGPAGLGSLAFSQLRHWSLESGPKGGSLLILDPGAKN